MVKKIFVLILFFSTCTNSSNLFPEVDLNDVESIVALLRIPTIAIKNNLESKSNKKYCHILNLSVDVLRLANEVLSIINKNGELEFHKYDYLWAAYDTASLISHLADLFNKSEDTIQDPKDIKKLERLLRAFHTNLIPLIEGLTAFLASFKEGNTIEDVDFRLKCKSLNSAIRLFDNIITSKNKSTDQILYGVALVISIILTIKDLYEISKIKEALFKEVQERRQAEEARLQKIRAKEGARRQAEEDRQRKILEEEEARRQVEEARLEKIRKEANASVWSERLEMSAEETQLREAALHKWAFNPVRLAWESLDSKEAEVANLQRTLHGIEAEIGGLKRKLFNDTILEHRFYSPEPSPVEQYLSKDSFSGKQRVREMEERRIKEIASHEFDRRIEEKRMNEQIASLEKNKLDISSKLKEVKTAFVLARQKALELSRQNT